MYSSRYSENSASESLNEPLLGFFLIDSLESSENTSSGLSSLDSLSSSSKDYVEVHAVDTSRGIILYTEINMLFNTESKVTYIDISWLILIYMIVHLPSFEKFFFLSSYSLTLRPLFKSSSALSPLTVTWTAIFSFLLIPKLLMVYLALDSTGF